MSYLERLTANNVALETILNKVLEYNESIVTFDPTKHMTYTGQKTVIDDGDGNWRVKFLSSGQVTFTEDPGPIDVFCVGGGGGGGCYGGGGGGGGYTTLESNVKLTNFTNDITIGAGGTSSTSIGTKGGTGGTSSAFGVSATGGIGGNSYSNSPSRKGGDGGSGGGGGTEQGTSGGVGGTDGSDGTSPTGSHGGVGGTGQGSTTREFYEFQGTSYSTGGGGGNASQDGAGGGNTGTGINGGDNTGGGGGGKRDGATGGGVGGSGIVVIRNRRNSPLRTYLFEEGAGQKVAFSTGEGTNGSVSVSTSKVSISRDLSTDTGHEVYWLTTENQSLAGKTSLVFRAKCTDILNQSGNEWNGRFLVLSSKLTSLTAPSYLGVTEYASVAPTADSTTKEYIIDVSELNGSYSIGWWGCGTVEIYDVYMV